MLSLICSGFFLAVSAVLFAATLGIPGATDWDIVGSRLVPQIYIGGLALTSLVLFIQALYRLLRHRISFEASGALSGKTVVLFLSLLAWIALISAIGFYLSTFVFLLFLIWFLNGMKLTPAAPIAAAACPAAIFFLFEKGLNVILPAGALFS